MRLISCTIAAAFLGSCATAQEAPPSRWAKINPDWVEYCPPFQIVGEIYYVGARGLGSFLIAGPDGHFLIDGGLPENASMIASNIEALGYKLSDVKYLLNTHAHFDHSGGLAELKKMTGAIMVASEGDRQALETGLVPGSEDDPGYAAPPVAVDRIIKDGETISLGGVVLTARVTPGHTKGCTSWMMRSEDKDVLIFCSATVAANRLVSPPQYVGIVDDYRRTFAMTKEWRPDILLANHPSFFKMDEKRRRAIAGDKDAFVDPDEFQALMAKLEAAFEKSLSEQTARSRRP